MNISQHCFVPLGFKKGFYTDSKDFSTDEYNTHCSGLIHVDNCNSVVLYRRVNFGGIGGYIRFFSGESLNHKFDVRSVSQYPYSFSFNPASDMECTMSYGIPAGFVDFLVYDDPNSQPTRMRLGSINDLNDEEIHG